MTKGQWIIERSSGYDGFRCLCCGTWIYDGQNFMCDCDRKASLHVGLEYRLDKDVRINGPDACNIPSDTVVKLLYFDSAVANVEVIEGAFDGLTFAMPPTGLL